MVLNEVVLAKYCYLDSEDYESQRELKETDSRTHPEIVCRCPAK